MGGLSTTMGGEKILLVPTDFSEDAIRAVDQAAELSGPLEAQVKLLHVYPRVIDSFRTFGLEIPAPPVPELRRSAAVRLDQEVERLRGRGLEAEWLLREGSASEEIVRAAQEIDAWLIVMGTRGRSGLSHVMLGSVAERTLRMAPCPVLTVRAHPG